MIEMSSNENGLPEENIAILIIILSKFNRLYNGNIARSEQKSHIFLFIDAYNLNG